MKNNKILYFIVFALLIISTFMISPVYCKYTHKDSRTVTINIRKPNYKVVFNSNTPTGATVSGTMSDQNFVYGISQNLYSNNYTITNYNYINWNTAANGSGTAYANNQNVSNLTSNDNGIVNLYAQWNYTATPTITRSDHDTFTYSAPNGAAYYVSKSSTVPSAGTTSSTFALNTWTSATNTGDLTLASGEIYYVFAKDADGHISANSANIAVKKVTRSQGTGTTLTTKYESSSGTAFTTGTNYVLNGTPIYVNASANTGYRSVILKQDGTVITGNTVYTINANTTFMSTSEANVVTINLKNENSATTTGYSVSLSTSSTSDTGTTYVATNSTGTVTFNAVPNGTYYVWSGKKSTDRTTRIYSGQEVVVNNNSPSAVTAQYYSLTLANGTGISAVSNGGTSTTNAVWYLYNASNKQSIAINATIKDGYAWSKWTKTSGTNLSIFTAGTKSQDVQMGAGNVTLTATAVPIYLVDKVKIGDYVNYNVSYSNPKISYSVNGDSTTYSYKATLTGWRVAYKTGSGANGKVYLVSAGIPLSFYRDKSEAKASTAETNLSSTTKFLNIAINSDSLVDNTFHKCGFATADGKIKASIFPTAYTNSVRALTKADVETSTGLTINDTTYLNADKYKNLWAVPTSTTTAYAGYFVGTRKDTKNLWAVYHTSGAMIYTTRDHGIRPLVELKQGIKTSGGNGAVDNKWVMVAPE